jgi:hypothetical protein
MRYVSRTLIGLGLFAFLWAVTAYAIFQLLQIGTCASGGPYVSARQCPDGTEGVILSLTVAIPLYFVAAVIYATRGPAPGSNRPPNQGLTILWFWTGLFWSLAVGCFLGVWGPDANPGPGGEVGGLIVGFMGLIMGAGGLFFVPPGRGDKYVPIGRSSPQPVVSLPSPVPGLGREVDRRATLDRLRSEGAVSDAEYEALKGGL